MNFLLITLPAKTPCKYDTKSHAAFVAHIETEYIHLSTPILIPTVKNVKETKKEKEETLYHQDSIMIVSESITF